MIATSRTINSPKSQIAGWRNYPAGATARFRNLRNSGDRSRQEFSPLHVPRDHAANYPRASITEITRNCTSVPSPLQFIHPSSPLNNRRLVYTCICVVDIVPRVEGCWPHAHARARAHTHAQSDTTDEALTQRQGGMLSRQERADFPQARTHSWFTSRGERRQ